MCPGWPGRRVGERPGRVPSTAPSRAPVGHCLPAWAGTDETAKATRPPSPAGSGPGWEGAGDSRPRAPPRVLQALGLSDRAAGRSGLGLGVPRHRGEPEGPRRQPCRSRDSARAPHLPPVVQGAGEPAFRGPWPSPRGTNASGRQRHPEPQLPLGPPGPPHGRPSLHSPQVVKNLKMTPPLSFRNIGEPL